MHLKEILEAVLIQYEFKLGKSNVEMEVIRDYISNNVEMSKIDFDIDNANRTFKAISEFTGFSFSILQKLSIPRMAEIISNNLVKFVTKEHQELFPSTTIDNAADLVFKMFLLAYLEKDNLMKNLTIIRFIAFNQHDLLSHE